MSAIVNSWLLTTNTPDSNKIIFCELLTRDDENDSDCGRSRVRYWFVSIFEVTTKKITSKKTISIRGVISTERLRCEFL
jgi:hypothetical protein